MEQVRGYVDDETEKGRKEYVSLFCTVDEFKKGLAIKARETEIKADDAIEKVAANLKIELDINRSRIEEADKMIKQLEKQTAVIGTKADHKELVKLRDLVDSMPRNSDLTFLYNKVLP